MSTNRERAAIVATRRFGLGAAPGEIARLRDDPQGAVLAQLDPAAALLQGPELMNSAEAIREIWAYFDELQRLRDAPPPKMKADGSDKATPPAVPVPQQLFGKDMSARLDRQIATTTPFVERLVNFWSNHFCIAVGKGPLVRALGGAYEREVIRPHVLGRFADMLAASAHHPAMLAYLDNTGSIGPTSMVGRRTGKGLNENLGREILELHTLGVDGGYGQADVTAFSSALTGWGVAGRKAKVGVPGTFQFTAAAHEPGDVTILGKTYTQSGVDQAEAALADFARHPATARHVARKFARHFVGDRVSQALIGHLETVFRDTDGDLKALAGALVGSAEAWSAPPRKVLPPWDLLIATGRLLGVGWSLADAVRMLTLFGQPLWDVPFPQGWPDDDEAWAPPAALFELLDAMSALSRRVAAGRNVPRLAEDALGPLLAPQTRQTLVRAETPEVALTLFLMSPDFLRR
jgi:uncharacterized protein (DUF1800 family)